jgi:hypothetical protein
VSCTENCAPCQCPLNGTDADIAQDTDPTITVNDDPDTGSRNSMLDLGYVQNAFAACSSPDCPFSLRDIEIRIECDSAQRDCSNTEVMGKLQTARIVHQDGSETMLPAPTTSDEGNTAYRDYAWRNMTLDIVTGESFKVRLRFDDDVARSNLTKARITIARPMPFECNANGTPGGSGPPVCDKPSASIPIPAP